MEIDHEDLEHPAKDDQAYKAPLIFEGVEINMTSTYVTQCFR